MNCSAVMTLNMLGSQYPRTVITEECNTKERILLTAVDLFARSGYHGVSVKDIASVVNIKPASIYNHFVSKEALWLAVLDRISELYKLFFDRFDKAIPDSESVEEIIDTLFYEIRESPQMFIAYGIALVITEQFHSQAAADVYNDLLLDYSVDCVKQKLDTCVAKGNVKPFDTQYVATVLIHSMQVLNNTRVHADMGRVMPNRAEDHCEAIRAMVLSFVAHESAIQI